MQEGKVVAEKILQIAEEGRKVKSKGERERYTQVNAGYQRITRTDKKAFLSEQYKEVEENKRIQKTRDLFKKIGDIKGTFHARMAMIKDRNVKDLTEAERLRRGGKNTQKNCTKKCLNDWDNHDGVVIHIEPDILEYEVKWAL